MSRIDLESAIIGAIAQDNSAIQEHGITEDLFINEKNIKIFKKIKELGKDCSFFTLSAALNDTYSQHLQTITDTPYFASDIPPLINQIRKIDVKENVKNILANFDDTSVSDIISKLQDISEDVNTCRPTVTSKEAGARLFDRLEKCSQSQEELSGVTSGFGRFDEFTWGFQKDRVYILAARPSMGKSTVAMNIALHANQAGKRIYIQALEEGEQAIMTRMLSKQTQLNNENLNKGKIAKDEWGLIADGVSKVSSDNMLINDSTGISSTDICKLIKAEHNKKPLDLIIIDHIQEVRDKAENRRLEVTKAASNLRGLAKSLHLPVILVSQLSRGVESRADKIPMLSDLRESGDLEAIADVVILLYRKGYYTKDETDKTMEFIFAKNRDGRTGKIVMEFKPETLTVGQSNVIDILNGM